MINDGWSLRMVESMLKDWCLMILCTILRSCCVFSSRRIVITVKIIIQPWPVGAKALVLMVLGLPRGRRMTMIWVYRLIMAHEEFQNSRRCSFPCCGRLVEHNHSQWVPVLEIVEGWRTAKASVPWVVEVQNPRWGFHARVAATQPLAIIFWLGSIGFNGMSRYSMCMAEHTSQTLFLFFCVYSWWIHDDYDIPLFAVDW